MSSLCLVIFLPTETAQCWIDFIPLVVCLCAVHKLSNRTRNPTLRSGHGSLYVNTQVLINRFYLEGTIEPLKGRVGYRERYGIIMNLRTVSLKLWSVDKRVPASPGSLLEL